MRSFKNCPGKTGQYKRLAILTIMLLFSACYAIGQNAAKPVKILVDVSAKSSAGFKPIWAFFGYDEANYTYMKDGKKLLAELQALSPVPVFVRTHNLLTSGNGVPVLKWSSTNAYTEDQSGHPIYNWKITDSIFDTYIKLGMKPLAQVGFMPEALSSNPESDGYQTTTDGVKVKHYTGWNYPPKDYHKFDDLVYNWVKHCVDRYGQKEVLTWYWEIWNEPDISYWKGTTDEYIKLYDFASDGIKRALPGAKVGGPETTNPGSATSSAFLKAFLTHVAGGINAATGKKVVPLDFITFHAKGDPTLIKDTVWMNMGNQLRAIDNGFEIISQYPSLKNLPVIIGESDPEGCAACAEDRYPKYAYRNGTMYASYTAASIPRIAALAAYRHINLTGALTWGFEFEDQNWFRGFRDLATNGVDKPVLNVFRMFGMLRGREVKFTSNQAYPLLTVRDSSIRNETPDISGIATATSHSAYIMVWNYHDKNDTAVLRSQVALAIKGIPSKSLKLVHFRIDQGHSNSYTAWKRMHSPQTPDSRQYQQLEAAGKLQTIGKVTTIKTTTGVFNLKFDLPRQGISLLKITW